MASYGKNIVPEYSYWVKEGQAPPDDMRGRIDFGAGGAAYYTYPLSDFNIWSEVYVACAGCNCELAIFITYTDKESLEEYTYTIALPSSGFSGPLPLHSVTADSITFRIKAYTAGYIERLTVQPVEQSGTTSGGGSSTSTAVANNVFSSIGLRTTYLDAPAVKVPKGYEYNIATLCLKLDPATVSIGGVDMAATNATITIRGSVTAALLPNSTATSDIPVTATLYYGIRQIKSTVGMISATYTTGDCALDLMATLRATVLTEYDLLQNIPLILTISAPQDITVYPDSVSLTATGDCRKLDAYAPGADFDESTKYPRFCATYNSDGRTIDKLWYLVRVPGYKYNIYAIDYASEGYKSDAESNSLIATYMGNFVATSSKAQIQAITRIDYMENNTFLRSTSTCTHVATHETMLRFWLYQGTLYCSTLDGNSQVTLATNVVDFDTVQQGVYSWPDSTYSTHGLQHIMGVTVFYAKSDGTIWFATYPDPTSTSFDYITVPYDSTAWKTYQVTLPTSISGTLTSISNIAISTPRLVDNNDSNTTCISFGLWASVTDSVLGSQDLYGYVAARKRYTSTDSSGTTKVDPAVTEVRTYGFSYFGMPTSTVGAIYGTTGDRGVPCYIVAQPSDIGTDGFNDSMCNSYIVSNHGSNDGTALSASVCAIAHNLHTSDSTAPSCQSCPPILPAYSSGTNAYITTMPSGDTMAFIYDEKGVQIYNGLIPFSMFKQGDGTELLSGTTLSYASGVLTINMANLSTASNGIHFMSADQVSDREGSVRTRRTIVGNSKVTHISKIPMSASTTLELEYSLRKRAKTNFFEYNGWLPLPHVTIS